MRYGKHFVVAKKMIGKSEKKLKLLDIGAANRSLKKYLPENIQYFSLDYKNYPNTEENDYLVNLDEGKIPIKNNSFDIIVCLETLEHLVYPSKVMKEIFRIGKKEAIFILSLPNEFNIWSRFQFLFGIIPHSREPFKVTEENRHIHVPRVKDSIIFFSKYVKINKIDYVWQSRTVSKFFPFIDNLINRFVRICPNLFSRVVIIRGKRKDI